MNQHKLFFVFLLCLIPFTVSAQRTVSGRVSDAENSIGISDAAVFIANSTIGTTTDSAGYYRLKLPEDGNLHLGISHVAYHPVFTYTGADTIVNVAMQIYEMKDVTVTAKAQYRNKDVDVFWSDILGKKPSPKTIHVLNPEAVYFYYNSKTQILRVTCRVPLQMINYETGFKMQYVLSYFIHNYKTDLSSWEGQCYFTELEPETAKQKQQWEINRKKIYQVSITNFTRSLYHNTLWENGFLLAVMNEDDDPSAKSPHTQTAGRYQEIGFDQQNNRYYDNRRYTIRYKFDIAGSQMFLNSDSTLGYKSFFVPSDKYLMLICFGKSVTNDELKMTQGEKGRDSWQKIGLYRSNIITPADTVHILSNGAIANPMRVRPMFSSGKLTSLNMILPLDYRPDGENERTNALAENELSVDVQPSNPLADSLTRVAQRFDLQLSVFPQEKLYLHTDKPYYLSGERIWFRAHVVDAATHVPSFSSGGVFVELFDARDSVVCRVKTGAANDLFSGYISIPEDAPEGDYTLRAYTNSMRNLDEDYFFIKNIRIGDPMSRMIHARPEFEFLTDQKNGAGIRFSRIRPLANITPESVKISVNDGKPMNMKCENGLSAFSFNLSNTEKQRVMLLDAQYEKKPFRQYIRIPLPDDDFDVSFFPEGGAALAGCTGRTAIKAMQRDGTEINVSGVVYNRQGDEVTNFKTDVRGMGQFTMKPERDDSYYAVCTNDKGQSKRFELPVAREDGYALSATWFRDRLTVNVLQPLTPDPSPQERGADTLCLIVHTRGVVQDVRILERTDVPLVFPKDFFPSGVTNLLLLNREMIPVSERLVFVNNDDQAMVECSADKDIYSTRSQVEYAVNITDESGEPLLGNFSVSVTDNHDVVADSVSNILTSLLLTSDLRGHIPDPAYYFRKKDQSSVYALDLLMLTQGWRRYDTERIVRNDLIQPDTLLANGYDLSGTVKYTLTKRPAENAGVSVLSFGGSFSEEANTDRNGRFYLHVGEIYDSTRLVVQTSPQLGRQNLELSLDQPTYPERTIPVITAGAPDREQFAQYADKAEQQYVDEHGTRVIPISEVTITAQKKKTVDYSFFYKADDAAFNITEDDLKKLPAASMSSLLMRLPGVNVTNGKIIYPGRNVILRVDDVNEPDEYVLNRLGVSDIAQIDFITNQAITDMFKPYSETGNNPLDVPIRNVLISINTKRGKPNARRETYHIKPVIPLGFQRPAEFYTPKYDTPAKNTKPDLRTTIHWQPNITTDEDGKASFSFYTADTPSTYTVVIEGMTADGKIVYKRDKIAVK